MYGKTRYSPFILTNWTLVVFTTNTVFSLFVHLQHLGPVLTAVCLSWAHMVQFFFYILLGLYLSDCMNMMIMSHCGISFVINVRLYDSQDALRKKKTCPEFYIINPYTFSDWELRCTRDRSVGCHEKYMNGVFKKNSVCSSTHPHDNSGTTSVYIKKATYQMNSVSQFMADKIIILH